MHVRGTPRIDPQAPPADVQQGWMHVPPRGSPMSTQKSLWQLLSPSHTELPGSLSLPGLPHQKPSWPEIVWYVHAKPPCGQSASEQHVSTHLPFVHNPDLHAVPSPQLAPPGPVPGAERPAADASRQ